MAQPPGTPRINVGSFPETPAPQPPARRRVPFSFRTAADTRPHPLSRVSKPGESPGSSTESSSVPEIKEIKPVPSALPPQPLRQPPVIPTDVLEAPTQRLYAAIFFMALQAWKFYDAANLYKVEGGDSIAELWFAMKWISLDGVFLWFLPELRIPWLDYSQTTTLLQIIFFTIFNMGLAFKISVPVTAAIAGFFKVLRERELAINERSVKWHEIINNSSHIQGKYTVHILPEGAAKMNPDGNCYCVDNLTPLINIPIRINGTTPLNMQIARTDLETNKVHIMEVNNKETKKLFKASRKADDSEVRFMTLTVKEPGLYQLRRMKDISTLDVRIYRSEALVVNCPKASVKTLSASSDRCVGDLSDFAISVEGLAPLKIKYGRTVQQHSAAKGKATVFSVQSVQPENFESPFLGNVDPHAVTPDGARDVSWAKPQYVSIPLNESLSVHGTWHYSVDEVEDACGNVVNYSKLREEEKIARQAGLGHEFNVHSRPKLRFDGCDPQNAMDLARGKSGILPLLFLPGVNEPPYTLRYEHTPNDSNESKLKTIQMKSRADPVVIKEPGLYQIKSVSSNFCQGEIIEPASCLVITPPQPSLSITTDEIKDKCTKSSIGLTIDLTLVGTPPFNVKYRVIKDKQVIHKPPMKIDRTRHQVRFTPEEAGHYVYEFYELSDKVYDGIALDHKELRAEQTVKPPAGAAFVNPVVKKPCIDEAVDFEVRMIGTGPWKLSYDLIYSGKRTKFVDENIVEPIHVIKTPVLKKGGRYSLALATVEDANGCKTFLESETQIDVRFARPKARFAPIDGRMEVKALEGKVTKLPLRMSGEGPWTVHVRTHYADGRQKDSEYTVHDENSSLTVNDAAKFELLDVRDAYCPGSIDESGKSFEVGWIGRPKLRLQESPALTKEGDVFVRREVCEGDEDSVELSFLGKAPFKYSYEHTYINEASYSKKGAKAGPSEFENSGDITAALQLSTIRMDTKKAGYHSYKFNKIADSLYHDPKESTIKDPIVLAQRVNPLPSSELGDVQKVYKYCLDGTTGDDVIPIHLNGVPPFAITINIKHFSTGKSEQIEHKNIESNVFHFTLPSRVLTLGQHAVSVLSVQDGKGCIRKTRDAPHVLVAVADMPSITPRENQLDYCVGDRIAYSLQGVPPFFVEYEFEGSTRRAQTNALFVRVAERPGNFTIISLKDSASDCKVNLSLTKIIHEVPSVKVSGGNNVVEGIHEGDQAEIVFDLFGTPPFTFTYTRSEIQRKGQKPKVVEMHSQTTANRRFSMFASQEGTYEVTSVEDRYCSYPKVGGGPR